MNTSKKILFIINKCSVEPLGIMYLSAMAKDAGFYVLCHKYINDFVLQDTIKSIKPQFVCFSMTTGQHVALLNVARSVKKIDGDILTIAGGSHPTFFPEVVEESCIDYIIRGEADFRFVELLYALLHKRPENKDFTDFSKTPITLDSIKFPDRDLVYHYDEYLNNPVKNVLTSRGCPYSCSYCYNSSSLASFNSKKVRYRSVGNVITEICRLKRQYGSKVGMIFFADDEFTTDIHRLKRFYRMYKTHVKIPFHCQVRIDHMTEEKVYLLKKMGCISLTFAIESGNEEIRRNLLNRHMSNSKIVSNVKLLKKHGIKFRAENMIGLPQETFSNMLETLRFNRKLKPDYAWCSIFQPYPGTKIEEYCRKNNLFDGSFSNFDYLFSEDSVLNYTADFKKKLKNLQRLFSIAVEFDIVYLLIKFLIRLNLNDFYTKLRNKWKMRCYSKRIFNNDYS